MRTALKLDGKGQYFARTDELPVVSGAGVYNQGVYNNGIYNFPAINLGIINSWTLGFWVKPSASTEHMTVFSTGEHAGKDEIRISTTPIPAEEPGFGKRFSEMRIFIKDANGITIKHYGWPNWFQAEEWVHTTVQWDGADLEAFRAGIPTTTGVNFVTVPGIMVDALRKVYYGSAVEGDFATFSGTVGHFGMWNTLLAPAELGTVVSGGFAADLTVASGTYVSQDYLRHYWKPGDDSSNIGKDFVTSGTLNLDKERNVNVTNVTSDEP